jgi:5'-nucleotidase / UDP-sugar diphosphatase
MHKMSRRSFLKGTVLLGTGVVLTRYTGGGFRITMAAAGEEVYKLRIIHTNDHHARIEPANLTIAAGVTRDFGGVARRKTLFDTIRAEADGLDKLFLDAGDVFQGTLYFNKFEGQADLFFYNALGYDAMAVGNHEFDRGDEILANFIKDAQFPILSANISVAESSPLAVLAVTGDDTPDGNLGQRTIITTASNEKIGIFGLTTPDTGILSSPSNAVTFATDLAAVAQAQVNALVAAGCTKIIALTHLGYEVDLNLAQNTRGIDVIVGGHSHTPLIPDHQTSLPLGVTRVAGYPTVVKDLDDNHVAVVTDWEWGKWVGDLVVGFDAEGRITSVASAASGSAVTGAIHPVWAGGISGDRELIAGEEAPIEPDETFQTKIDEEYKPEIVALQTQVIGQTAVFLDGDRPNVRSRETNLGNLITDAMRKRIQQATGDNPENHPIVAITNGGGIRSSIAIGDVTVGQVISVLPFGNTLARVDLTGAQVIAALENGVSQVESGAGRFPQVSGLRFTWDRNSAPGSRIVSVEVLEEEAAAPTRYTLDEIYVPLDLARTYRVVTNNFMLTGGDGYSTFAAGENPLDTQLIMADEVQEYIAARSPVNVSTDGRITAIYRHWMPLIQRVMEEMRISR